MAKPGEQCEHGQLRRQCLTCDLSEEIEELKNRMREIYGRLGAALCQSTESDDQIIMGHVRDACELAKWRAND